MSSPGADDGRQLVFLVGAGRSGSTLLYKLLGLHPEIAFVSNFDAATPLPAGWLQRISRHWRSSKRRVWFGAGGESHGRDRSPLARLLPTPVEGEPLYARCGVPLFEDGAHAVDGAVARRLGGTLDSIRRQAGARWLLTKRVANNRRLSWLTRGLPAARFIHLVRDGRDVAHSFDRVAWWNPQTRIWWDGRPMQALLDEGMQKLEVCARTWVEVMRTLERELEAVPPHLRMELRYETLLAEPGPALESIYRFLGVDDDRFAVETLREIAFRKPDSGWRSRWSPQQYDAVMAIQSEWLARYDYRNAL